MADESYDDFLRGRVADLTAQRDFLQKRIDDLAVKIQTYAPMTCELEDCSYLPTAIDRLLDFARRAVQVSVTCSNCVGVNGLTPKKVMEMVRLLRQLKVGFKSLRKTLKAGELFVGNELWPTGRDAFSWVGMVDAAVADIGAVLNGITLDDDGGDVEEGAT